MNREKNLPNCFKCPTGVFHGEDSGWILHTHLVRLQLLGTRPSSVYFLSLFYCVEGSLDQGTVDINPVWLCARRWTLSFWGYHFSWGEGERGPWGNGWGIGREVFSAQGLRSLSIATSYLGGWWEKPHSYSWQFRAPGSLGSEAVVWPFFLKGGIRLASC